MRRGTTPTITITTDIDLREASNFYLTFKQGDKIVFEKTLADVTINENEVLVWLDQDETLLLSHRLSVEFQIRATLGDQKVASNIMQAPVDGIIKDGEI